MQDIYDWIDAHRAELVTELQELLRQPSISAQKIGLVECAELLKRQIELLEKSQEYRCCPKGYEEDDE